MHHGQECRILYEINKICNILSWELRSSLLLVASPETQQQDTVMSEKLECVRRETYSRKCGKALPSGAQSVACLV